jgi:hypothetical protein
MLHERLMQPLVSYNRVEIIDSVAERKTPWNV